LLRKTSCENDTGKNILEHYVIVQKRGKTKETDILSIELKNSKSKYKNIKSISK
jgi:hypothetical protein